MPFIIEYVLSLSKSEAAFTAHQQSPQKSLADFEINGEHLTAEQIQTLLKGTIDEIRAAIQAELDAKPAWLTDVDVQPFPVQIFSNVGLPPGGFG